VARLRNLPLGTLANWSTTLHLKVTKLDWGGTSHTFPAICHWCCWGHAASCLYSLVSANVNTQRGSCFQLIVLFPCRFFPGNVFVLGHIAAPDRAPHNPAREIPPLQGHDAHMAWPVTVSQTAQRLRRVGRVWWPGAVRKSSHTHTHAQPVARGSAQVKPHTLNLALSLRVCRLRDA
jgi:hypothetical protein